MMNVPPDTPLLVDLMASELLQAIRNVNAIANDYYYGRKASRRA